MVAAAVVHQHGNSIFVLFEGSFILFMVAFSSAAACAMALTHHKLT